MSARGLWIAALGAALAFLIALNVFRYEEPLSAGANEPSGGTVAAGRPVEAGRASPSADAAESRDAAPEPQPVPVPTPGPYTSIAAALADHDVPPERRMPANSELLETDRAFAAERVDPVWSTAAEAGVLRRISEIPGVAYVSVNVECRTTLCLLQLVGSATPVPNSGIVEVTNLVKAEGLQPAWTYGIRVRGGAPLGIAYLQRVETAEGPVEATEPSVR